MNCRPFSRFEIVPREAACRFYFQPFFGIQVPGNLVWLREFCQGYSRNAQIRSVIPAKLSLSPASRFIFFRKFIQRLLFEIANPTEREMGLCVGSSVSRFLKVVSIAFCRTRLSKFNCLRHQPNIIIIFHAAVQLGMANHGMEFFSDYRLFWITFQMHWLKVRQNVWIFDEFGFGS